jgi:GNAT superfamily N-acetyltransferase
MIDLRPAEPDDAAAVQDLLGQLGYPAVDLAGLRARLALLSAAPADALPADAVLVALAAGRVVGLVALHRTVMLQAARPVARITTLVVDAGHRGTGIGRALVEAAADLARQAGSGRLELTTGLDRTAAHDFYRAIGFAASSLRMHRDLG